MALDITEKKSALETSLERAAELLGDITPHVYDIYYRRCPEAKADFEYHFPGDNHPLEGQMVEQALYCLMEWYDSPGEIEIILLSTVPHHIETLKIEPSHFSELIVAVCETIVSTIPAQNTEELAVWEELRGELMALFEASARYARPAMLQPGSSRLESP